ncbi:MAG: MiaB/RimO family radical SAM methylthiotransferase [Anaerolineae bacterium]|nr:MiaB/RimO family radical SAM methylthiotransferase [Anaerolineae bacterium]
MKTYHIWTIGCQMNVADSAHLAAALEALGYRPAAGPADADVVVLNTCVVRQSAEERVVGRLTSLRPLKARRPQMVLAVMGCLVGVRPAEDLPQRFPQVDVFLPPSDPEPLLALLRQREEEARGKKQEARGKGQEARGKGQEAGGNEHGAAPVLQITSPEAAVIGLIASERDLLSIPRFIPPVTAYVPVIYGCNHVCAYCIVPYRRGRERSRPVAEIVAEVQALVEQGVREVTLLGQIVDRYGYDWRHETRNTEHETEGSGPDLADLLRAVHEIRGLWRIRFLTSHPNYFSDRILEAVAELPKVCEHIEVPVQAGDDEVLRRMRRGYTVADYRALVQKIRRRLPGCSIATDVIVGFPGETEAQFRATYDLLAELRLDMVHVAAYSPRPGTLAARKMVNDVPDEEKQRRRQAVEALQERIVGEINSRLVGQTVEVLVEEQHKGKWRGRTRTNKLVFFQDDADWRGRLAAVRITWAGPWSMQGEVRSGDSHLT